jgi:hypothetical protein
MGAQNATVGGSHSQKGRQNVHHKDTHKYEKQKVRTALNKLEAYKAHAVTHPCDLVARAFFKTNGYEKYLLPEVVTTRKVVQKLHTGCTTRCRTENPVTGLKVHHCGSCNWGLDAKKAHLAYYEIADCRKCQKKSSKLCYLHDEAYGRD